MATRVISTSIKLDGEAEFKKQLGEVNSNLRNLDSEMKLVTEEFKGQANTTEALTAKQKVLTGQIDQQAEKVRALEEALGQAEDAYGKNDKRVDNYQQSLNRAKAELIKMQRELDDTNKYLNEAEKSADGAAKSIDGFGKSTKNAGGKGGLSDLVGSLGNLKGAFVGSAVVAGVKELGDAMFEVVDGTKEYREIMGTLETSSQAAGYSAEETAEAYERLYGVLGDTQTTATTVANLQAIGLSQEDLMEMVDAATGAWASYGDSIPIDGLAESINETIQAGQVTGTFADVLNWAGTSEDEFNEKLENASTASERANIVMEELAKQGLADTGRAWRDVNDDIVNANEAQAKWDESVAKLGEFLSPAVDALRSFGADALEWVVEKLKSAVEWINNLIDSAKAVKQTLSSGWDRLTGKTGTTTSEAETTTVSANAARVTRGLTSANIKEQSVTQADVYNAAATAVNAATWKNVGNTGVSAVKTTINIDGRAVAEAVTPAMRDINKSNPEVVSDLL